MKKKVHYIGHGLQLHNFLNENNITAVKLAKVLERSPRYIAELFKKEEFNKTDIILVCYALNIKSLYFNISSQEFASPLKKEGNHSENMRFVQYKEISVTNENKKVSKHFTVLKKKIDDVQNNFRVYDYMVRKTNPALIGHEDYTTNTIEYFRIVKTLSLKKNAVYERILALPINFKENDTIMSTLDLSDLKREYIDLVSLIRLIFDFHFEHIIQCFLEFGNKFQLYLLNSTTVKYSYHIADESTILIEADGYDIHTGDAEPDILMLHTLTPEFYDKDIQRMISIYTKRFQHLCQQSNKMDSAIVKINIHNIKRGIQLYTDRLDDALKINDEVEIKRLEGINKWEAADQMDKTIRMLSQAKEELEKKNKILSRLTSNA